MKLFLQDRFSGVGVVTNALLDLSFGLILRHFGRDVFIAVHWDRSQREAASKVVLGSVNAS